jgi:hypothetical protein
VVDGTEGTGFPAYEEDVSPVALAFPFAFSDPDDCLEEGVP